MHWQAAIAKLAERMAQEFSFSVHLCGEIECVIDGLECLQSVDVFWQAVLDACADAYIALDSIAHEEHPNQYEFRLKPTSPLEAAHAIDVLRQVVLSVAQQHDVDCRFEAGDAEPFCGLHLHVHLANAQGVNVFLKQEEEMTPPLRHALGGLLASMCEAMLCFAPSEQSYARIASGADHVPRTVSWGGNNRTVALRLPESVVPVRHIEHRVSGADACPYAAIWAVLAGMHLGLSQSLDPGAQMFGDASDAKYALPLLPDSYAASQATWEQAEWLAPYRDEALALLDA